MTKEREKELLERIAMLEKRLKELEAIPVSRIEYHYYYQHPQPYYAPTYIPAPMPTAVPPYPVWYGTTGTVGPYLIEDGPHRIKSTVTDSVTIS